MIGGTKAMLSLALATMNITTVGVFIPVAVLIVDLIVVILHFQQLSV